MKKAKKNKMKSASLFVAIFCTVLLVPVMVHKRTGSFLWSGDGADYCMIECAEGGALIEEPKNISEVIRVLSGIKGYTKIIKPLTDFEKEYPPDASMDLYYQDDEKGDKSHHFELYGNLVVVDDSVYRLMGDDRVYQGILRLCGKYGDLEEKVNVKTAEKDGYQKDNLYLTVRRYDYSACLIVEISMDGNIHTRYGKPTSEFLNKGEKDRSEFEIKTTREHHEKIKKSKIKHLFRDFAEIKREGRHRFSLYDGGYEYGLWHGDKAYFLTEREGEKKSRQLVRRILSLSCR